VGDRDPERRPRCDCEIRSLGAEEGKQCLIQLVSLPAPSVASRSTIRSYCALSWTCNMWLDTRLWQLSLTDKRGFAFLSLSSISVFVVLVEEG
jgi:hypothetical protein